MARKPAAPAPPPAPTAAATKSPKATIPDVVGLTFSSGLDSGASRIVIYGTAKIGKSTLAAYLPAPVFFDVERGSRYLNVTRDFPNTWLELRGKLAAFDLNPPEGVRSIVIDSATMCEEMAKEHVIATVKTEGGLNVSSIEGFGWGKGWQFISDQYIGLLADLDRLVDKGFNVCLIAHDVACPAPNPSGEEFLRYEPHLYSGDKKGRGSIRNRVQQWSDHIIFIGYDVFVKDGKGIGSGSRTIYTQEMPTHIAGSRSKQTSINFDLQNPAAIWTELGIS